MQALLWSVFLLVAHPNVASSAAKPKEPPHALLSFSFDVGLKGWITTFEMTTAKGKCYEVSVTYSQDSILSSATMTVLLSANWMAYQEIGSNGIRVYGARTREGSLDAISSLRIINRLVAGEGEMPHLGSVGGVKVEVITDKGSPAAIQKLRPTGPDLPDDTFVEFDIAPLPTGGPDEPPWQSAWDISFGPKDPNGGIRVQTDIDPAKPCEVLDGVLESFLDFSCKAEIIGKTRLRVYGRVAEGRFLPVLKGSVDSDDLKPEELPKVTNARS